MRLGLNTLEQLKNYGKAAIELVYRAVTPCSALTLRNPSTASLA